jgi:hypothetical protein
MQGCGCREVPFEAVHSIRFATILASGGSGAGYQRGGSFCRMVIRFFSMLI